MSGERGRAGVGGERRVTGAVPLSWHAGRAGRPRGHALACGPRLAKARPSPGSTRVTGRTLGPRERWGAVPGHPWPCQRPSRLDWLLGTHSPRVFPRSPLLPGSPQGLRAVLPPTAGLGNPAKDGMVPRPLGGGAGSPGKQKVPLGGAVARWAAPRAQFSRGAFLMMWLRLVPHPPSSLPSPCLVTQTAAATENIFR